MGPKQQSASTPRQAPGSIAAGGLDLAPEDPFDEAAEIVADAALVAAAAARLDEGPAHCPSDSADDLTPETLLGGHRDQR